MGGMSQMPMTSPTNPPIDAQPPMGNDGMMDAPIDQPMDNGGDENTKEVQELSGKLSQKLNDINSQSPNPEISKYALNMVKSAADKGINGDTSNQQVPMGESITNFNKMVNEIVNQVLDISDSNRGDEKIRNPKTRRKNPFNPNLK